MGKVSFCMPIVNCLVCIKTLFKPTKQIIISPFFSSFFVELPPLPPVAQPLRHTFTVFGPLLMETKDIPTLECPIFIN